MAELVLSAPPIALAFVMLWIALTVRRVVIVLASLFVAPGVALWWLGYVHGNGFKGGKETIFALIVATALLTGGLIGMIAGRCVRSWKERRGYLDD